MNWTLVTPIVSAIAVAVTLSLFVVQESRSAKRARIDVRRENVGRALATMEAVVRHQALPYPLGALRNADLEYALLVPRLLLELDPQDRAVAEWVSMRTTSMRLAPRDKVARDIGIGMCSQLVAWHHGRVETQWFAQQVAALASEANHPTPSGVSWKRASSNFGPALGFWLVVLFLIKAISSFIRS